MKTMKTIKMSLIAVMLTIVTTASAMTYSQAKVQALFLADKMAYELNLTDEQYEAAYEINLDYLMAVKDYNDLYGYYWTLRNQELQTILSSWQYNAYVAATYFYRPVYWSNKSWVWRIYTRYARTKYYKSRPAVYVTYRGGNSRSYYASRTWNVPSRTNTTAKRLNTNSNNKVSSRTSGRLSNSNRTVNIQNNSTVNIQNNSTINIQNNRQTIQSRSSMTNSHSFGSRQNSANTKLNSSNVNATSTLGHR